MTRSLSLGKTKSKEEMIEAWMKKGVEACEHGDFRIGLTYFNQVLGLSPQNHEALYQRAKVYFKLNELKNSIVDFQQLLVLQPGNAHYRGEYAIALHLDEQNSEAALEFDRATSLEPENPYRYASRAFFKDRIGDAMGAISDYEKTLALDPEDAIALNNKGLIEEKMGYMNRAKQSFDRSNRLVNYKPKFSGADTQKEFNPSVVKRNERDTKKVKPLTRGAIICSLLTREGFNDFTQFLKEKFSR